MVFNNRKTQQLAEIIYIRKRYIDRVRRVNSSIKIFSIFNSRIQFYLIEVYIHMQSLKDELQPSFRSRSCPIAIRGADRNTAISRVGVVVSQVTTNNTASIPIRSVD